MSLLVLGGTGWLGLEVVRAALVRGADVTCLTRGRAAVPAGARSVVADRTVAGAYNGVLDRDWDAVLDTTWQPGMARSAVAALSGRAGCFALVSSTGVYVDHHADRTPESAQVVEALDADVATDATYAAAKVACERAVVAGFPERHLVARSGLLGGTGDVSDRFGYWVSRFAVAGDGPVLVPDADDQPVQVCDARDLAIWLVDALHTGIDGTVNAVGPTFRLGDILAVARDIAGATGPMIRAGAAQLESAGVQPWFGPRSLPLWRPTGFDPGFPWCDDRRLRATGFQHRDLDAMTADTLTFEQARGLERNRRAGLTRPDELKVISHLTGVIRQPGLWGR